MFTSMSDIGFPSQGVKAGEDSELLTAERVQRMLNTQNNWRVRTKTIDELLHLVQARVASNPQYLLQHSQELLEFFLQLLNDQNFKIVLNTLNILNLIVGMPQHKQRSSKEAKASDWGLGGAVLSKYLP
jgi:hypothetical protein